MDSGGELGVLGVVPCCVCGDENTCYSVYGAVVCSSCRVFFRRQVKSKSSPVCSGSGACKVDTATRNNCRSCRFGLCISVGMQPDIVDAKSRSSPGDRTPGPGVIPVSRTPRLGVTPGGRTARPGVIPARPGGKTARPGVIKVNRSLVKAAAQLYPTLTREVWTPSFEYRDFEHHYRMASQNVLEQEGSPESAEYRRVLTEGLDILISGGEFPGFPSCPGRLRDPWCRLGLACQTHLYRFLMTRVLTAFLRIFLPSSTEEDLQDIAQGVLSSYIGLMICLNGCFGQRSFLEQMSYSSPYPDTCLRRLQEEGGAVPAVSMDSYMVSPWLERVEEEEVMAEVTARMVELVEEDPTLARLATFLTAFSPVKRQVDGLEEGALRQYRHRITSLLYEHLYTKHGGDSVLTSEKLSRITSVLELLDRVGSNKWLFTDSFSTGQGAINLNDVKVLPLDMGLE